MKIAVFFNTTSGGAKRTVYEEVSRLAKTHTIDVFATTVANQSFADIRPFARRTIIEEFQPGRLFNTPFGRLNHGVRSADLLRLRTVMKRLADHINQGDYDVALVHPCMYTFSPTILRYLKKPALYYRHDPVRWLQDPPIERPYHQETHMRRKLDQIDPLRFTYFRLLLHEDTTSMQAASHVVTNSYFTRESLYRIYHVAPAVCYPGVDHQTFSPLNLERQNFVMSVGAVAPYKGYDFLIKSLAYIPQNIRPRLVLVGNNTLQVEQKYLSQLAEQLDVEVDFFHLVSNDELLRLYNQAICTVYAPYLEPFGLVPLESMACGTPVVGIREGGVRETVVDGVTGLLADRNPEEFAGSIVTLLKNRALIGQFGKQARSYVEEHWTWRNAIANLEGYLQKTVIKSKERTT